MGCTSLTSVVIPESVKEIGEYAFSGCTSLTSVVFSDSVTEIGEDAFSNCVNLTSITVDKNNPKYDSRDNCNAVIETKSKKLICGCAGTVIPDSVKKIGDFAFYGCDNLSEETKERIRSIQESSKSKAEQQYFIE